jgi:hypothetical protein
MLAEPNVKARSNLWFFPVVVFAVLPLAPARAQENASEDAQRARETRGLSRNLRNLFEFAGDEGYYSYIGGLTKYQFWRKEMPLGPAQSETIPKLDGLVRDAAKYQGSVSAVYMDTNPADYADFMTRFRNRLNESRRHAERMVTLGLLTEPQAAFFIQHILSGPSPFAHSLGSENVQEMLGMSANQKKEYAKVMSEWVERSTHLSELNDNERIRDRMSLIEKLADTAARDILTPQQMELWNQLTAERHLPAEPPDLPAISDGEAARIKLTEISPIFRSVGEMADSLKLSAEQKKFFGILEEITREGMFWISLSNSKDGTDSASQSRAEFVRQAEQVALFGILTPNQAEQVHDAMVKGK